MKKLIISIYRTLSYSIHYNFNMDQDPSLTPNIASEHLTSSAELHPQMIHDPIDMVLARTQAQKGNILIACGEGDHHGTGTLGFELVLSKQSMNNSQ